MLLLIKYVIKSKSEDHVLLPYPPPSPPPGVLDAEAPQPFSMAPTTFAGIAEFEREWLRGRTGSCWPTAENKL